MNGLSEMWGLPVFIKKNKPQINTDERRFINRASSAVRSKYTPQITQRGEQ